jgi:hypothetical protein
LVLQLHFDDDHWSSGCSSFSFRSIPQYHSVANAS